MKSFLFAQRKSIWKGDSFFLHKDEPVLIFNKWLNYFVHGRRFPPLFVKTACLHFLDAKTLLKMNTWQQLQLSEFIEELILELSDKTTRRINYRFVSVKQSSEVFLAVLWTELHMLCLLDLGKQEWKSTRHKLNYLTAGSKVQDHAGGTIFKLFTSRPSVLWQGFSLSMILELDILSRRHLTASSSSKPLWLYIIGLNR